MKSEQMSHSEVNNLLDEQLRLEVHMLPVVNYALQQNGVPIIRSICVVNNSSKKLEDVELQISVEQGLCLPLTKHIEYAQCWTSSAETDAMWRCYAYDNRAIRIRTRKDKLYTHTIHVFPSNVDVCLRQVSYDLDKEIAVEQQIHQIKNSLLIYEPFFHKRDVFDHEQEFRLLVTDLSWTHAENLSKYPMNYKIHEKIKEKSDEERIDYLSEQIYKNRIDWEEQEVQIPDVRIEDAGNVSDFLEGVMVHPLAESWYVEIVRNICQSRNITFEGQSKLYELE